MRIFTSYAGYTCFGKSRKSQNIICHQNKDGFRKSYCYNRGHVSWDLNISFDTMESQAADHLNRLHGLNPIFLIWKTKSNKNNQLPKRLKSKICGLIFEGELSVTLQSNLIFLLDEQIAWQMLSTKSIKFPSKILWTLVSKPPLAVWF